MPKKTTISPKATDLRSRLNPSYERWMWIELLGFDVELSDYGVEQLCERAGFVPTGVTLLLCDPEFVHGHTGRLDRTFGPGICSYGGHPNNEDRQRQVWTAHDLLGLVTELQGRGIQVFFSHMDMPVAGWVKRHPEILFITREGKQIPALSPYKRLATGKSYGEYYLPLMLKAVRDFGFDGLHAADGFAHPRIPIYEGDFSDDTVDQYQQWSGENLSSKMGRANGDSRKIEKRADWIWRERRLSWIEFHRARALDFWKQAASSLHEHDKKLIFNSCWTRDPFEAVYRYGVDYRALTEAGVDAFLAETAAAVQEYGGDLPYGEEGAPDWNPGSVIARFSTNLYLLRAASPRAKIIFMNGIKDTNEAWNGIRHAPTNLEAEILSHTATFSIESNGTLKEATDGVVSVLSDGLASHEWAWVRDRWELGYSLHPKGLRGAAVYWSDAYEGGLVRDYIKTRRCPLDRILWRLSVAGAPLLATVRKENAAKWNGVLIVVHPHLLPVEEWQMLLKRKNAALITIGGPIPKASRPVWRYQYSSGEDIFEISAFGWKGTKPTKKAWPVAPDFDVADAVDPVPWLIDLPSRDIPDIVFQDVAEWITTAAQGIRVLKNTKDIRAWAYETAPSRMRIYVRNSAFYYRHCVLDSGRVCAKIKTLTAFPANPVKPDGSQFRFKMAGKSMAVFDVFLSKKSLPK